MRILVVEDNVAIAQNIREFLASQTFTVDIVHDGDEGFELAAGESPYDALILDVMLPGRDGISVCRDLRARGIETPIIMLTARDTLDARVEGLDHGADDYLVKPFALKELLARINALIRRNYRNLDADMELHVGELSLNTRTKKITREGQDIVLSKKHYQLLEFLMRNAGRVVSKQEIEEHLWDRDAELWSDVVRSHIQLLRARVDRGFDKKLIKTVHSMGYTINND